MSRPLRVDVPGGVGPYEITVANGAGGLPESMTSVGGTVSYSYDQGWRMTGIAAQPGGTFALNYNPTNGLISSVSGSVINASYAFDSLDRVVDISWKDAANNALRSFAYQYNTVGMITQKVTTLNGQQTTNIYAYDSLDRLASESSEASAGTHQTTWTYDLAGNRLSQTTDGTNTVYTVGLGNRLVSWGTNGENTASYNSAGCVTQMCFGGSTTKALTWDSRYRLISVATNGAVAESYGYDALDRRVSISDGSTTNYLIYDGIHVIAEVGTSGSLVRS